MGKTKSDYRREARLSAQDVARQCREAAAQTPNAAIKQALVETGAAFADRALRGDRRRA